MYSYWPEVSEDKVQGCYKIEIKRIKIQQKRSTGGKAP